MNRRIGKTVISKNNKTFEKFILFFTKKNIAFFVSLFYYTIFDFLKLNIFSLEIIVFQKFFSFFHVSFFIGTTSDALPCTLNLIIGWYAI